MLADVIRDLKATERQLETQLQGIRAAIIALGEGGVVRTGRPAGTAPRRRRRRLSAKARAAISRAQKLRWAKARAAKN